MCPSIKLRGGGDLERNIQLTLQSCCKGKNRNGVKARGGNELTGNFLQWEHRWTLMRS